jgi:hypothetical protein
LTTSALSSLDTLIGHFSQQPLAIITGASGGMGSLVADRLALRGYRMLLIGRRKNRLEEMAARYAAHAPAAAITCDLCDPSQIDHVLGPLIPRLGGIDLLVNGAGVGMYRSFLEHTPADHHRLMQVNYFSMVEMTRRVLPGMLERRRGQIINIASMSTKVGPWGHAAYSAAKAAMVSLTQTLAIEHAGSGVKFSYVNPGIVDTPYFRSPDLAGLWAVVKRWAIKPEIVADRIVGLLDRHRIELCVPRHYRVLDWVVALSPQWALKMVGAGSRPRLVGDEAETAVEL